MAPFFSIVIPTRNRPGLARMSSARVLAQNCSDFELVILDNSDDRLLQATEFSDSRCAVFPSATVLSMSDNWERLLDVVKGEYVLVLSDKDMMLFTALSQIKAVATSTNADMITFRKACFGAGESFVSTIQRCSGETSEQDAEVVIRAWFDEVMHFHDAPMIYNSAVRRKVLLELRRSTGRFFYGTSPDIGSGAVLMSKLKTYQLIDRPLVVSWYGSWSIGVASGRGVQGAAAECITEYGRDPMRDAGLVSGVAGSVAETLLECKAHFPSLFASYELCWSSYVRNVLEDLANRERVGIDVGAEYRFLLSARDKRYSWLAIVLGFLRHRLKQADEYTRLRRRTANVMARFVRNKAEEIPIDRRRATGDVLLQELTNYFRNPPSHLQPFRDVPVQVLPRTLGLEDTLALAYAIDARFDRDNQTKTDNALVTYA